MSTIKLTPLPPLPEKAEKVENADKNIRLVPKPEHHMTDEEILDAYTAGNRMVDQAVEYFDEKARKVEYADRVTETRQLTLEEIQTLVPIFSQYDASLPNPAFSSVAGHIVNGEIVGFLVTQLMIHAEPLWIKPGHSDAFMPMLVESERHLMENVGECDVLTSVVPDSRPEQMAIAYGLTRVPLHVYSKHLVPKQQPTADGHENAQQQVEQAVQTFHSYKSKEVIH